MYLAGTVRPDIAFAVNYLARKQLCPTESDWEQVERVFRYLRGTTRMGLLYRGKGSALEANTDSSFRDCEGSDSTGGYIILLFGDTIGWNSGKQCYVSLSTCQAEYLALSKCCQEIISLDKATRNMLGKTFYPVKLWCDNKSSGDCTRKDGSHKLKSFDDPFEKILYDLEQREKSGYKTHMADTHGDFIKQCVMDGFVTVKWISTKENIADIMTKPLSPSSHTYLRNKIFGLE